MIIEKPLQARQVDCICDACKRDRMRPTGVVLMSEPPQYTHRCDKCGEQAIYPCQFPYVRYVSVASLASQ